MGISVLLSAVRDAADHWATCKSLCGGGGGGGGTEEQVTWAAQKHSEAGDGRPVDRGVWTAKTVERPRQQPAHPQYANYWAPLTRKRHTTPHSAQSQHANYWAPRTRKRHQQEHRPQRPTDSSDPTQHAKGRTGDRPGPRKGATTRRNVTQGGTDARRRRGEGGLEKWASVLGPLFCVRTDVGAGTQILARKRFFTPSPPHICVVKMISAMWGSH